MIFFDELLSKDRLIDDDAAREELGLIELVTIKLVSWVREDMLELVIGGEEAVKLCDVVERGAVVAEDLPSEVSEVDVWAKEVDGVTSDDNSEVKTREIDEERDDTRDEEAWEVIGVDSKELEETEADPDVDVWTADDVDNELELARALETEVGMLEVDPGVEEGGFDDVIAVDVGGVEMEELEKMED